MALGFTLPSIQNTLSTIPCHQLESSFLDELLTEHYVYTFPHIPISLTTPYLFFSWHQLILSAAFENFSVATRHSQDFSTFSVFN